MPTGNSQYTGATNAAFIFENEHCTHLKVNIHSKKVLDKTSVYAFTNSIQKKGARERERERERETDKKTERERQKDRDRDRDRERQRQRETETERDRDREKQKGRQAMRQKDR